MIKDASQIGITENNGILRQNTSYASNANKINNIVSNFDRLQGLIGGEILS